MRILLFFLLGYALLYGLFLFSYVFPETIRKKIIRLLLNDVFLYFIVIVVFFIYYLYNAQFNVLHCDGGDKEIIVTIKGVEITGLTSIASQFGAGAAFVIGAKIAQAAVAKKSLGLTPKIAIPIFAGAIATGVYGGTNSMVNFAMNRLGSNEVTVIVDEGSLKAVLKDDNVKSNLGFSDPKVLKELLETVRTENIGLNRQRIAHKFKENDTYNENASAWLETELKNMNTESGSGCVINSPLEGIPQLDDLLIVLNASLKLNLIVISLLIMLTIILTVRFLTERNYSLDKLKSNRIGSIFAYILEFYIKMWKGTSIFWIYIVLILIFISIFAVTIWLYVLIFFILA